MGRAPEGFLSTRMEDFNVSQGEHSWVIGRGCLCQVPRLGEVGVSCEDLRWRWCRGKLLEKSPHIRGVGFTSPGSPPFASLLLSAGFPARVIFLALLTK